jgi:hypothetical protein
MMHLVHVRLCRAATKSGDKDWYKKIDEKVIEDCMQLGACCTRVVLSNGSHACVLKGFRERRNLRI